MATEQFYVEDMYRWYEDTEEPLWHFIHDEVLSWWLRDEINRKNEYHWFVEGYPLLAPYYPSLPATDDPMSAYMGYWWP